MSSSFDPAILNGLKGSVLAETKVGPAGVHIWIKLCEQEGGWIDILCCGKLLLVSNAATVVVDTSNYIDRAACRQIPVESVIAGFDFDKALGALALMLSDERQLVMQAVVRNEEYYPIFVSRWHDLPYASTQQSSGTIEASIDGERRSNLQ
jgi:hypothetical protein